jgi:glycine/D-amino acid oxidase-like deaminating enzyme/nitrite reductase/ring-hydroxylating ferredoxin subunit
MTDRARDKDSVWTQAQVPAAPPLANDHTTTVCVIGAGIAGLTTAYLLAKQGRGVIVLDDGPIGGGESGLTTAHLVTALDRRWSELAKLHSSQHLLAAARSHAAAIDRIESIVEDEHIDCDFRRLPGYLFAGRDGAVDAVLAEIKAAHDAGMGDVVEAEQAPLKGFNTGRAARFTGQGQLHVLRDLAGLVRAIEAMGGHVYTNAHVTEVDEETDKVHVLVKTDRGVTVRANEVVLATNTPIVPLASVHLKQTAYRSYVVALPVPRGSIFPALYWDTEDPFHYVRLANLDGADGPDEMLLVGGEDHEVGVADDTTQRHWRLEAWARERFPEAGPVAHRWSGQVMETVDGLAYIGRLRSDSRILVATGDCGVGMTHGTIAGMLIDDLIHGRDNPWAAVYDPGRVNLSGGAAAAFVKKGVETLGHYAEWITRGELPEVDTLPPGAGAIMRRGLSKLAVYRDPQGQVHARSAVCPHLGCIVAWNAAEKTWDCPCHGSRFGCTGKVLHGPATSDLAELGEEKMATVTS